MVEAETHIFKDDAGSAVTELAKLTAEWLHVLLRQTSAAHTQPTNQHAATLIHRGHAQ